MNPFEPPPPGSEVPRGGPPPVPRWARIHPVDGPMMALLGAGIAWLGRYIGSLAMVALGALAVMIGLGASALTWMRWKR